MEAVKSFMEQIPIAEDDQVRSALYDNLKTEFAHLEVNRLQLGEELVINLADTLKKDSLSTDTRVQLSCTSVVEAIVAQNMLDEDLEVVFIKRLMEDKTSSETMQKLTFDALKSKVLVLVQSGAFNTSKLFTESKEYSDMVRQATEDICKDLPKEECVKFLVDKVIPFIFNKNMDDFARGRVLDMGFQLLQFVNVSSLPTREQEALFLLIGDTYVKTVGELRDENHPNWHKLWIFLLRFCDVKVHSMVNLANKLLRIIEVAFRNSTSIEQRLRAYDCWQELIDNWSLNMTHMCSSKQIKLLITPMKAKFSRMPVVILKRFEIFAYLLNKLQDKTTLCLKEFLEFCFGPFEEKHDLEKMRQGKSVPEVCVKSTAALMEIIGHNHKGAECLKSEAVKFNKPIIDASNFHNFSTLIINSVIECCILLNDWTNETNQTDIIHCLWRSLLQLISQSNSETKQNCISQITGILKSLQNKIFHNKHYQLVLGLIIENIIADNICDSITETVLHASLDLLCHRASAKCFYNVQNIQKFVFTNLNSELSGSKLERIILNYFNNESKWENFDFMCELWTRFDWRNTSNAGSFSLSLVWPIRHLNRFKDFQTLKQKWVEYYVEENLSDSNKSVLFGEIEKIFLNNPLLSSKIIQIVEQVSLIETNVTKDFLIKFMRLMASILTLSILPSEDLDRLIAITIQYFDQSHSFYTNGNNHNDDVLSKLCANVESIVVIHKNISILTKLENKLTEMSQTNRSKFSSHLTPFLEGLMLNEDGDIASQARKLIELVDPGKEDDHSSSFSTVSSSHVATPRSMRMVNMVGSNNNGSPRISPGTSSIQMNSLRLFGKNLENSSPLSVKGSLLSVTPSRRSKQMVQSLQRQERNKRKTVDSLFTDDKSSDYVKIDSEVKLQVDKLSEHQKEMLKRKREDIPALYQDLSQSQSQDLSTGSSEELKASDEKQSGLLQPALQDEESALLEPTPFADVQFKVPNKPVNKNAPKSTSCSDDVQSTVTIVDRIGDDSDMSSRDTIGKVSENVCQKPVTINGDPDTKNEDESSQCPDSEDIIESSQPTQIENPKLGGFSKITLSKEESVDHSYQESSVSSPVKVESVSEVSEEHRKNLQDRNIEIKGQEKSDENSQITNRGQEDEHQMAEDQKSNIVTEEEKCDNSLEDGDKESEQQESASEQEESSIAKILVRNSPPRTRNKSKKNPEEAAVAKRRSITKPRKSKKDDNTATAKNEKKQIAASNTLPKKRKSVSKPNTKIAIPETNKSQSEESECDQRDTKSETVNKTDKILVQDNSENLKESTSVDDNIQLGSEKSEEQQLKTADIEAFGTMVADNKPALFEMKSESAEIVGDKRLEDTDCSNQDSTGQTDKTDDGIIVQNKDENSQNESAVVVDNKKLDIQGRAQAKQRDNKRRSIAKSKSKTAVENSSVEDETQNELTNEIGSTQKTEEKSEESSVECYADTRQFGENATEEVETTPQLDEESKLIVVTKESAIEDNTTQESINQEEQMAVDMVETADKTVNEKKTPKKRGILDYFTSTRVSSRIRHRKDEAAKDKSGKANKKRNKPKKNEVVESQTESPTVTALPVLKQQSTMESEPMKQVSTEVLASDFKNKRRSMKKEEKETGAKKGTESKKEPKEISKDNVISEATNKNKRRSPKKNLQQPPENCTLPEQLLTVNLGLLSGENQSLTIKIPVSESQEAILSQKKSRKRKHVEEDSDTNVKNVIKTGTKKDRSGKIVRHTKTAAVLAKQGINPTSGGEECSMQPSPDINKPKRRKVAIPIKEDVTGDPEMDATKSAQASKHKREKSSNRNKGKNSLISDAEETSASEASHNELEREKCTDPIKEKTMVVAESDIVVEKSETDITADVDSIHEKHPKSQIEQEVHSTLQSDQESSIVATTVSDNPSRLEKATEIPTIDEKVPNLIASLKSKLERSVSRATKKESGINSKTTKKNKSYLTGSPNRKLKVSPTDDTKIEEVSNDEKLSFVCDTKQETEFMQSKQAESQDTESASTTSDIDSNTPTTSTAKTKPKRAKAASRLSLVRSDTKVKTVRRSLKRASLPFIEKVTDNDGKIKQFLQHITADEPGPAEESLGLKKPLNRKKQSDVSDSSISENETDTNRQQNRRRHTNKIEDSVTADKKSILDNVVARKLKFDRGQESDSNNTQSEYEAFPTTLFNDKKKGSNRKLTKPDNAEQHEPVSPKEVTKNKLSPRESPRSKERRHSPRVAKTDETSPVKSKTKDGSGKKQRKTTSSKKSSVSSITSPIAECASLLISGSPSTETITVVFEDGSPEVQTSSGCQSGSSEDQTTPSEGQTGFSESQTSSSQGPTDSLEEQTLPPEGQMSSPQGQTFTPQSHTSSENQTGPPETQAASEEVTCSSEDQTGSQEVGTHPPEDPESSAESQTGCSKGNTGSSEGHTGSPKGQTTTDAIDSNVTFSSDCDEQESTVVEEDRKLIDKPPATPEKIPTTSDKSPKAKRRKKRDHIASPDPKSTQQRNNQDNNDNVAVIQNSEDFMESERLLGLSPTRRSLRRSLTFDNAHLDEIEPQQQSQAIETIDEDTIQTSATLKDTDSTLTKTPSDETLTETATCDPSEITILTPVIRYDLPVEPQLTESEKEMALMTTVTVRSDCLTPTLQSALDDNLPGSPVTCETPERNTTLLQETSNISPINSNSSNSSEQALELADPYEFAEESVKEMTLVVVPPSGANARASRLLQMVNATTPIMKTSSTSGSSSSNIGTSKWPRENKNSAASSSQFHSRKFDSVSSPSRVRKVKRHRDEKLDILTFSREIPSPLTVPGSSILKRKIVGSEEGSPIPKRKRVNFSDPAITEKKLFIKDSEDFDPAVPTSEDQNEMDVNTPVGEMRDEINRLLDNAHEQVSIHKDKGVSHQELGDIFLHSVDPRVMGSLVKRHHQEDPNDPSGGTLKQQIDKLNVQQLVDLGSDFFENVSYTQMSEISSKLIDSGRIMDVIKKVSDGLTSTEQRKNFLIQLLKFASEELPVSPEVMCVHTELTNQYAKRMLE